MKQIFVAMILAGSLVLSSPALGQENYCGTTMSPSEINWLKEWQLNHSNASVRGGEVIYVPLKVHIVGTDEGGGYLSLNTLMADMCDLNEQFAETGFYFYIYEDIDFINNSDYYNHDWYDGALMFLEHNVPNLVNIYFVGDPAGNCGYYSPSGNAVAVANTCANIGNSTIAHELGHFFSLPHTFYGWEWGTPSLSDQEQVDGDNCFTAGDGFCDTPPDYLAERWFCSGPPTFTDPDGVDFQPDGTYFMSYSDDACQYRFSPLQQEAMIDNINGPRDNLLDYPPLVITDVDSTILLTPEDLAENQYPNYTLLSWEPVDGAVAYEIQVSLTTTFTAITVAAYTTETSLLLDDLLTERTYRWRVRVIGEGNTCEGYSPYKTFYTGAEYISTDLVDLNPLSDLRVYPNPVSSGNMLQLNVGFDLNENAMVELFNATGSRVSATQLDFQKGRAGLQLISLPSGIYTLSVFHGGNRYSTALMLE